MTYASMIFFMCARDADILNHVRRSIITYCTFLKLNKASLLNGNI